MLLLKKSDRKRDSPMESSTEETRKWREKELLKGTSREL